MFALGRVLNRQSFLFVLEKNSNRKVKPLVRVGRKATGLVNGMRSKVFRGGPLTIDSRVAEEVIRLSLFRNEGVRREGEVFRSSRSTT